MTDLKWEDIEGGQRAEGFDGHYELRPDNAIGDWEARFYRAGNPDWWGWELAFAPDDACRAICAAHHAERLSLYRRGAEEMRTRAAAMAKNLASAGRGKEAGFAVGALPLPGDEE